MMINSNTFSEQNPGHLDWNVEGFFSFSFNSASTTQAALGEQLGLSLWYQHSNVECESSKFNGMKNEVF